MANGTAVTKVMSTANNVPATHAEGRRSALFSTPANSIRAGSGGRRPPDSSRRSRPRAARLAAAGAASR